MDDEQESHNYWDIFKMGFSLCRVKLKLDSLQRLKHKTDNAKQNVKDSFLGDKEQNVWKAIRIIHSLIAIVLTATHACSEVS